MILLHRRGLVLPLKRLHINIGQVHTWLLSGLAACCAVNTMGFSIHESTRNRCVLKWLMQESFKNSSPVLILWVGTDMGKLGDHRCGWHYTFCLVPAFPGSWTALTRWKKRKIQFRFWKISWRSVRKPKLWSVDVQFCLERSLQLKLVHVPRTYYITGALGELKPKGVL